MYLFRKMKVFELQENVLQQAIILKKMFLVETAYLGVMYHKYEKKCAGYRKIKRASVGMNSKAGRNAEN
jgi:hypothetical protein